MADTAAAGKVKAAAVVAVSVVEAWAVAPSSAAWETWVEEWAEAGEPAVQASVKEAECADQAWECADRVE